MTVTLHNAIPADLPLVKNLVSYCIHDLAEHLKWSCSLDGRFQGCNDELESYWRKPEKHPFVMRSDEEPVGYALIREEHFVSDADYSVTDFLCCASSAAAGSANGSPTSCSTASLAVGRWNTTPRTNRPWISGRR